MRRRCNNPNSPKYEWYGGMGVRVCDEWNHPFGGFENFYEWAMSNGYDDSLSIDRINSDGNYCPENCRWIPIDKNRRMAIQSEKMPVYQYFAYNESLKQILIFYKARDFQKYTGIDSRRVSDGCRNPNRKYHGWKFKRIPIQDANIVEGQETIPFGSTPEDELPAEVQIIRLDFPRKEYTARFYHKPIDG